MVEFIQFTLSGLSFGMIYAAIALSLVLIWRGTRLLNFAQGGMAMFTTYIALEVIRHTGSYWAGFVVALAAGVVLGFELVDAVVIFDLGGEQVAVLEADLFGCAFEVDVGPAVFMEGVGIFETGIGRLCRGDH